MTTTLDQRHAEILTHMLGAGPDVAKKRHGYRNRFCAEVAGGDHATLSEMAAAGLVKAGRLINDGRDQYFHATIAGCEAIGLDRAAIKRAMED